MTVEEHKKKIIKAMKTLQTYKKEYDKVIDVLAKLYFDYDNALISFEESGGDLIVEHTNKAGATNIVKNPYYVAIEGLRDDILAYSRELGLTPNGLTKLNIKNEAPQKSSLALALESFNR